MKKTDHELVIACQKNGDLKAFEELIRRHQSKIRSVIYRFLNNPQDLDDISQEAFIKAFRSLNSYHGKSSFSTWLCSIAINTCKDKIRSNKIHSQKVVNLEDKLLNNIPVEDKTTPDDLMILTEEQEMVVREIKNLPEQQKLALILYDIEEMSYEEISKILNCPVGTVKSRLFNARKTIKEKFKPILSSIKI